MDYRLASGFVGDVDIFPSRKQILIMVPVAAVVDAEGQDGYIYSVTDSGTVRKHKVNIETITGTGIALKSFPEGISEIVTEGTAYLKDGSKVVIVK